MSQDHEGVNLGFSHDTRDILACCTTKSRQSDESSEQNVYMTTRAHERHLDLCTHQNKEKHQT